MSWKISKFCYNATIKTPTTAHASIAYLFNFFYQDLLWGNKLCLKLLLIQTQQKNIPNEQNCTGSYAE